MSCFVDSWNEDSAGGVGGIKLMRLGKLISQEALKGAAAAESRSCNAVEDVTDNGASAVIESAHRAGFVAYSSRASSNPIRRQANFENIQKKTHRTMIEDRCRQSRYLAQHPQSSLDRSTKL